ncbi:hypothetical protein HK097_001001, partial [Rhizophlyctis rosea]
MLLRSRQLKTVHNASAPRPTAPSDTYSLAPSRSPFIPDHQPEFTNSKPSSITPSTAFNLKRSASGLPALLGSQHSDLYDMDSSESDKSYKSLKLPTTPSFDSDSDDAPPSPSARRRSFKRAHTFDGCMRSLEARQSMDVLRLKLSKSNLSEDDDDELAFQQPTPMDIDAKSTGGLICSWDPNETLVSATMSTVSPEVQSGKSVTETKKFGSATKRRTPLCTKPAVHKGNTILPYKSTKPTVQTNSAQKRRWASSTSLTTTRKSATPQPENDVVPPKTSTTSMGPPPLPASFQRPSMPVRRREAHTPPPGPRPVVLSPRTIRGDRKHQVITTLEARFSSPESMRILRGWQMGLGSIARPERN